MASGSSDEDDYVVLGTVVPEIDEDQPKKPTTIQDLIAKDKQGRRRFHGAFTGGFSAGFFNTVGTKEGFAPSTFVSSKNNKFKNDASRTTRPSQPEDFMDEEDLEEHGIAPRKFATAESFTSEERRRKRIIDSKQATGSSVLNMGELFSDLVVPEQLTVGIKLLRKMGWREGQGLGPRLEQKKKKRKRSQSKPGAKVYGCAPPPSDDSDSSDGFVPEDMSSVTFAPRDVAPILVVPKENVHGLGYRGLDPSLALPSTHINLFSAPPVHSKGSRKGISGQAFGVGAFEDEDEDIYSVDSLSNYDVTMQPDNEEDNKFGWTAPRDHGKQSVPVTYVGKLLEGFCLSKTQLKPKKKFPAPSLPRDFKPHHWFRKHREMKHIPEHLRQNTDNETGTSKLNAVDRGILLGENPVMSSVFDLIPKADRQRIDATKEAISMTKSLMPLQDSRKTLHHTDTSSQQEEPPERESRKESSSTSSSNFLSRFQPAVPSHTDSHQDNVEQKSAQQNMPLFQDSLTFQPFRKDPAKQSRYDKYLAMLKQDANEPYSQVACPNMTEWERARERDEFSKAAKMFRPMSALMSSRFVSGSMIDDDMMETSVDSESDKTDEVKAAEMKMFGKLTREEYEWHPHQLLCKRFNVPNPFPGSDIVGMPGVKRDKYSVFNFLSVGDFRSGETQEPTSSTGATGKVVAHTEQMRPETKSKKATMASVFKVLDNPNFHKPTGYLEKTGGPTASSSATAKEETIVVDHPEDKEAENDNEEEGAADMDLFRAIFKNSDSEESANEDEIEDNKNMDVSSEEELPSPDAHLKEAAAVQERVENTVVKTESVEVAEANKDSFRPLFVPRRKATVGEEANSQPQQRLRETATESATISTDVQISNKGFQWRSKTGLKSVFSVLEDMESHRSKSKAAVSEQHSGGEEDVDKCDVDDTGVYGPILPPSTTAPSADTSSSHDQKELSQRSRSLEKPESRKESRSSHKKEKRKKSKQRKHKKHKKHKKSVKSRSKSKKDQHSSGSEADSESDSDDSVSDSELLERLRDVSRDRKSLLKMKHL